MHIDRSGTLPTTSAHEANFTGNVIISGYFERRDPSRVIGATVTFSPGARTPWKVNPLGQTVIIRSGIGWMQCEGGKIDQVQVGDIVWFPPGERHWEGATPESGMTYFVIQEALDGVAVEFGAQVTEEEYLKGRAMLDTSAP